MANGINTDIFQPNRKEETRQNLYDAILGQQQDPQDLMLEEPDRPEFDEDRRQQLRRLSTVSAIGEGINALTNTIGVGTDDDWAPAQTGMSEMGVTAFNELARMDQEHRGRLDQWRQNVLDTRQANQQTSAQVGQQNAAVDVQAAKQRYQDYMNDAELQRQKNKIKREEQLNEKEAWKNLGLRLTSQGEKQAATRAYELAGLEDDEISTLLQGSGVDSQTATRRNMVSRYYALLSEMRNNPDGAYYSGEGKPISAVARDAEWIKEQLGADLFNPLYQPEQRNEEQGQRQGESYLDFRNRQARAQTITYEDEDGNTQTYSPPWFASPKNQAAAEEGLNRQQVQRGLEVSPLVEAYRNADNPDQQDQVMVDLERKLRDMGYDSRVIDPQLENMATQFGIADTASETNQAAQVPTEPISSQGPARGEESFEEFKERLNQKQMNEFSEETAQNREQLMNILSRLNSGATKLREIITSPLWALKETFNNLSERRQRQLYEEYQREQQQGELTQNSNE